MLDAASLLHEPGSLATITKSGERLRIEYYRVVLPTARRQSSDEVLTPHEILCRSVQVLELWLAVAGFAEAAQELGVTTESDVTGRASEILARARTITGFDPVDLVIQHKAVVEQGLKVRGPLPSYAELWKLALSDARAFVEVVPLPDLEALAAGVHEEELGDRCRRAYRALRALGRRTTSGASSAGRAYRDGRLTLQEVADLLEMPPSDAVAFLEEHGFHRSEETIRPDEASRKGILAAIRKDRLARSGQPVVSVEMVRRDVVASQRIEGVDARPWT